MGWHTGMAFVCHCLCLAVMGTRQLHEDASSAVATKKSR